MVLLLDVGNTQIKICMLQNDTVHDPYCMDTFPLLSADEYGEKLVSVISSRHLTKEDVGRVVISSVVPDVTGALREGIFRHLHKEALIISTDLKTDLKIRIPDPHSLGTDLLAGSEGALIKYGAPFILIDFGTATKYEFVNNQGEFGGCVICPGIGISAKALFHNAALLPDISLNKPATILTNETNDCIAAGLFYGALGQTEYIVRQMKQELGASGLDRAGNPCKVIATGGLGRLIAEHSAVIDLYDPLVIMEGIKHIMDLNS